MKVYEIDWRPPLAAFAPLAGAPYAFLLHAGETCPAPGWSMIAAFPAQTIEARGRLVRISGRPGPLGPLAALREAALGRAVPFAGRQPMEAPFLSGLLGYIGYEIGAAIEPTAEGPRSPFDLPDMAFGAYDALALFDRAARRAFISARSKEAADRLEGALGFAPAPPQPLDFRGLSSNFSPAGFREAVADAVEMIRDGRMFQVNLAHHLSARSTAEVSGCSVFARIAEGDAPFAACLQFAEGQIVSNSPERFFRIAPGEAGLSILAEPVKGTRPRGRTPAEDAALAEELLTDPKERAENVMIADLARNDLSRVCQDGSIREEAICALASHATVHHLVSRISGRLRVGLGAVDALEALFPCGSVTGAPKVEAMKTIAALEPSGRGPYCGAIGYLDDRGGADFSVAIRTLVLTADGAGTRATLPVGAGVTLRSDPDAEYLETLVKARGLLAALGVEGALAP